MKTNLISIVIILFFSILVSLPLLKSGLYLMHDDQHVARLFVFDQALKAGQFPVRWVGELGFNFGYPLFVFYPPFVYILGEIYHLVGFGFIDSIKLVFFSSILFSGLAMYIFVKELWGKFPALISVSFYLLVPYRALDVYVRGALAESFSFVWLPLILWAYYKAYKTNKTLYIYLSAVFLALLMFTHNLIFLPFMLILPIYLIFLIFKSQDKKLFTVNCLLSTVFAFGLSAFFWIPALMEKKYTIVDTMLLTNLADFRIHFVYPQQLWNWTWGFGGSAAGLADGISFKIGKIHILTVIVTAIAAMLILIRNKRLPKLSVVSCQLSVVFFSLFILSAFMTTFYSKFIWDIITPLHYLQFPWRFLTFTALFSSILAGALIYLLRITFLRLIVGSILILLLSIPNLKLFQPQDYRPNLTDETATSNQTIKWDVSNTSYEYIPDGVSLIKDTFGNNKPFISRDNLPKEKIEVISGDAHIDTIIDKPHKVIANINVLDESVIRANIFNFPNWQVYIDNNAVQINDNNALKLISFELTKGMHEVEIKFENTPVRSIANLVTVSSIVILSMLVIRYVRGRSGRLEVGK